MFSIKDYTILNWTKSLDVFGVVMQDRGERFAVTAASEKEASEGDVLPERLKRCYRDLSPSKDSVVVLSGHINQGVYLELKLPLLKSSDVDQLLQFELARRIPFDVEDLIWCHEPVAGTFDEETGKVTFRVFAVPAENWTHLISELQLSGIKADLFMPAFMSATSEGEYYFPTMSREFSLSAANEHGMREFLYSIHPSNGIPDISSLIEANEYFERVTHPRFIPAILCGSYIIKRGIKLADSLMELPKAMRPQRLLGISRAFWATFLVTSIMVLSVGARVYLGNSSRMSALKAERAHVDERLGKIKSNEKENAHINGLIEKINEEKVGEHKLVVYLGELTRLLPNNMRLTRFNMRDTTIDISIVCDRDPGSVIRTIRTNPHYDVLSVSKRHMRNVTSVNVKLGIVSNGQ